MADVLLTSLTAATSVPSGAALLISRPGATANDRVFGLLATTALTGVSSVNGQTGAVTIAAGVTSFQSRTGAVSLAGSDIASALGFTPYSAANPAGYLTPSTGVTSVNGQVGAVTVSTGSGGTAGVSSFQGRTGAVTLASSDVTGALGYTPYSSGNPSGYVTASTAPVTSVNGQTGAVTVTASGTYSLPAASATTRGGITVGANLSINGDVLSAAAPTPAYTLPVASASTLGGIKPGANVTIGADGTLTVPAPAGTYSLPAATATTRGGVTVGSGLAISGDVLSATAGAYTLPAATTTTRGGVTVGANISVSGGTISVAAPYVLSAATASTIGGVRPGTGLAVDGNGVLTATATATARTQRAITVSGTDTLAPADAFILVLPAATGVVALTLPDSLNQPVTVVNRKTDASAANRIIRITPGTPSGGGSARTVEADPFLDLDAGYVLTLTPVGRDWIATGYPA